MGMFEVSFHRYQRHSANISSNLSPQLVHAPIRGGYPPDGLPCRKRSNSARLVLLRGVHQRVDVVPAGRYAQSLSVMLQGQGRSVPADALLRVVAPVADAYDVILFDVAPGASVLGDLALAATQGPLRCFRFGVS